MVSVISDDSGDFIIVVLVLISGNVLGISFMVALIEVVFIIIGLCVGIDSVFSLLSIVVYIVLIRLVVVWGI